MQFSGLINSKQLLAVIFSHSVNAHSVWVFKSSYFVIFVNFFFCYIILYNTPFGRLSFICLQSLTVWALHVMHYSLAIDLCWIYFLSLFFGLYLRKYVNNLVIHPQKSTFAKFKADFSCNFTNFWPWISRSNLC